MSSSSNDSDASLPYDLGAFAFERVLDEDPNFHYLIVLGTLPGPAPSTARNDGDAAVTRLPAILRVERTAFGPTFVDRLSTGVITSTKLIGRTDIYAWMHGWLASAPDAPDVHVRVIFPATEVHVRKYATQDRRLVRETPAVYRDVVVPYIDAFPASRTQWVRDLLDGTSTEDVFVRTPRFVIVPDMKWDPSGPITSLYLLAIACDPALRSLRDLRGGHVEMLEDVRERAYGVVRERWGLPRGSLRMYVHYQPSYYRFHVHIVHAAQVGLVGMVVGQAHLLEDLISMLKHSPNILSEITLTYALGSQHGLYDAMVAAQGNAE